MCLNLGPRSKLPLPCLANQWLRRLLKSVQRSKLCTSPALTALQDLLPERNRMWSQQSRVWLHCIMLGVRLTRYVCYVCLCLVEKATQNTQLRGSWGWRKWGKSVARAETLEAKEERKERKEKQDQRQGGLETNWSEFLSLVSAQQISSMLDVFTYLF